MPVTRVAVGDGAADAAERPAPGPEAVEGEQREQQERALGVDRAEEERERKDRRQQHGALGAPPRQVERGETVQHDHRQRERHPRHDDAAEVDVAGRAAEQPADVAHQQRIDRRERDVAAPAGDRVGRVVALARDVEIPAGVVARERVPERARRCPTRRLIRQMVIERKRKARAEREERRHEPESDRCERDANFVGIPTETGRVSWVRQALPEGASPRHRRAHD